LLNQCAPVVREIILACDGVVPVHKFYCCFGFCATLLWFSK
jgi:hypothetical protein